jgi:hypothetical protein
MHFAAPGRSSSAQHRPAWPPVPCGGWSDTQTTRLQTALLARALAQGGDAASGQREGHVGETAEGEGGGAGESAAASMVGCAARKRGEATMATMGLWILLMWAVQGMAVFAVVYAAARMAIRHERR